MKTFILLVCIANLVDNRWQETVPMPLLYDFKTIEDCWETALIISKGRREDIEKYNSVTQFVSGGQHKNFICVPGPSK